MLEFIKRIFRKKKQPDQLILTDQQFAILQRLSGYFIYREQELKAKFPEIHEELHHFYNTKGADWGWYPHAEKRDHLSKLVESKPDLFQIEGSVGGAEEGTLYYTLLSLGITSTEDGRAIRRSQLLAERVDDSENSEEKFFDELSSI